MMKRVNSRSFSSLGRFRLPPLVPEPFQHYPKGSQERADLLAELKKTKSEVVEIPCVVGGKEIYTGKVVNQVIPSDHQHVIARFHQADEKVIHDACRAAQAAKYEWENMPIADRLMIFRKAADLISGPKRYELMAATMFGTGKNVWQAEIDAAVETIDFLRQNTNYAEQVYDQQPPFNSKNTWNRVEYRPLEGFVAAVCPFNFLAIGANLPTAPAMMGNTVLWKPASTAVLGNWRVFQILKECGIPDGVLNFTPSNGGTFGTCVNDRDFGGLHFTGSTDTFNHLWQQVGANLNKYKSYPRLVGETGGKNFHIAHKSANLEHFVNSTIRGAFEYQGQKCSATSRAYIPSNLWPQAKKMFQTELSKIKMGQPDDLTAFLTAVIDAKSFKTITSAITAAKSSPACEIIAGGKFDDSKGYFIEPTIIVTSDPHYATMKDELFGPVLTVFVYDENKWEETLKLVDNTAQYALTGAIFATERSAIISGTQHLRHSAGNFYINDKSTGAVVGEQPFGGGRMSGTNDKAGFYLNLTRWVSARTIKENTAIPLKKWSYPSNEV